MAKKKKKKKEMSPAASCASFSLYFQEIEEKKGTAVWL